MPRHLEILNKKNRARSLSIPRMYSKQSRKNILNNNFILNDCNMPSNRFSKKNIHSTQMKNLVHKKNNMKHRSLDNKERAIRPRIK